MNKYRSVIGLLVALLMAAWLSSDALSQILRPPPLQPQTPQKPHELDRRLRLNPTQRSGPAPSGSSQNTGQPQRQQYSIAAGTAYVYARGHGFGFSKTGDISPGSCTMRQSGRNLFLSAAGLGMTGKKCDFTLFSGRNLAPGWAFVSYNFVDSCRADYQGYSVRQRPQAGGGNITFRIHLWTERGVCGWYLTTLVLAGPANADWRQAFQ